MRTLVESLKRLYQSGQITEANISDRVTSGKITSEEETYIKAKDETDDLQTYYEMTQGILPDGGGQ